MNGMKATGIALGIGLCAAWIWAGSPAKPVATASVSTGWLTDFAAAQKEAAATGRPILADFSGSDWCGWCMKLDDEVFSKPAFLGYAASNLVLFVADFPRNKPQDPVVRKQNEALASKYAVDGFPTVLLLDATGKVLGQTTGYEAGGPGKYVEHIKSLLKKRGL